MAGKSSRGVFEYIFVVTLRLVQKAGTFVKMNAASVLHHHS
jgi:hypothetical protein